MLHRCNYTNEINNLASNLEITTWSPSYFEVADRGSLRDSYRENRSSKLWRVYQDLTVEPGLYFPLNSRIVCCDERSAMQRKQFLKDAL